MTSIDQNYRLRVWNRNEADPATQTQGAWAAVPGYICLYSWVHGARWCQARRCLIASFSYTLWVNQELEMLQLTPAGPCGVPMVRVL